MDYNLPGSSTYGILQARILGWVAISFSRGSSPPGDRTQTSSIVGRFFTNWAIREAPDMFWYSNVKPDDFINVNKSTEWTSKYASNIYCFYLKKYGFESCVFQE